MSEPASNFSSGMVPHRRIMSRSAKSAHEKIPSEIKTQNLASLWPRHVHAFLGRIGAGCLSSSCERHRLYRHGTTMDAKKLHSCSRLSLKYHVDSSKRPRRPSSCPLARRSLPPSSRGPAVHVLRVAGSHPGFSGWLQPFSFRIGAPAVSRRGPQPRHVQREFLHGAPSKPHLQRHGSAQSALR